MRVSTTSLLLLAVVFAAQSSCCLSARHRRRALQHTQLQPPVGIPRIYVNSSVLTGLKAPACAWDDIFGTCATADAFLITGHNDMSAATFGGWAHAFIVAAGAYCGAFPTNNCSYPCAYNGEVCALNGALKYGIYACPNSEAEYDAYCTVANQDLCNKTAACVANPKSKGTCIARFKANFTTSQQMQYLSDWSNTRTNVWGCCAGSETKWLAGVYCGQYSSDEQSCTSQRGCVFESDGTCTQNATLWLETNYGRNHMVRTLKDDLMSCAKITDATACANRTQYAVDKSVVRDLLLASAHFPSINWPVNVSKCVAWSQNGGIGLN